MALLPDIDALTRTDNTDDDFLNRVQAHLDAGGGRIVIVTGDLNMQLRAKARRSPAAVAVRRDDRQVAHLVVQTAREISYPRVGGQQPVGVRGKSGHGTRHGLIVQLN